MQELLGTSWGVFTGVTCILMGFAAFMTGQALANTWKPLWQVPLYCVLFGLVDRFLVFALFDGRLDSLSGYIIDTMVLLGVGCFGYATTRSRKMVSQYPWLYRRVGLFGWRRIDGFESAPD